MRAQRILLIRLSHLGDVVHALPVFHALRAAHPRAQIAWLVQSEFAELVAGLPGLDRVIRFERRAGARAWLALRDELGAFAPDLAVDAQGNLKSAAAALASGAARRLGPASGDWRERPGALAMTEHAAPSRGEHALERMLALARAAAGGARAEEPCFDLGLTAAERERARERWRALVPRPGPRAPLVVHLASPADVRAWPPEHFAALARGLAERELPAVLLSGPAEEDLGRALEREVAARSLAHWVGQRGLRELAAFLAAAAEGGARFLGCDSGPLHLAAAAGLPVVCLAGPQSHLRTGPWPVPGPSGGGPHRVLRAERAPACAPCLRRSCDHALGPVCMRWIEPARVLAALERPAGAGESGEPRETGGEPALARSAGAGG